MIHEVWMDVGNVIVMADHAITHRMLMEQYGVPREKAESFFANEDYEDFSRGILDEQQFYRLQRARLGLSPEQISFRQMYEAHAAHMTEVDQRVESIIACFYVGGTALVFPTNTNRWQTRRIEDDLIDLSQFGHVVRSHELGIRKRDPGGFVRFAEKIESRRGFRLDPSEILLIDDSDEEVKEGRALGLQVHQFRNAELLEVNLKQRGLLT